VLRLLAVVFTVAAVGSLVLVAVDLFVSRPAAGDVFMALLNSLTAVGLWRISSETGRT
jgi:hypothetical protein